MTDNDPHRPLFATSELGDLGHWRVEAVPESPSTNAAVLARAAGGEPLGLVLVTDHQSRGRGRLDRQWVTPPGSALTFSCLVRPPAEMAHWGWLPLVTGLAVRDGLARAGIEAGVKWPNDVLVGERKICGILVELVPDGSAAVIGVGLNVAMSAEQLPVPQATSVLVEGSRATREELLAAILSSLDERLSAWAEGGIAPVRAAYRSACVTLGRRIRAELPVGEPLLGVAHDVDPAGRLIVRTEAGETTVAAGDVVHVRAQG